MTTTRRDLLTAALTATAAVAVRPSSAGAQDHDHDHDHQSIPSDPALRTKALESLMLAKGLVDRAALDALIDTYEHKVGPHNGARVVARAWVDPAFKQRLLTDSIAAIAEMGFGGETAMIVVENTSQVHNSSMSIPCVSPRASCGVNRRVGTIPCTWVCYLESA
jgi:hypothetical protein